MKERGTNPRQEEMQILDGILIILENGWVLETSGLVRFLDLLYLPQKSKACEENVKFLEFIYFFSLFVNF